MKRKVVRWLLAVAFAALALSAAAYILQPVPLEVETGIVDCGPMQVAVSVEGKTRVRDRYTVSSPIEAYLGRIDLKEGSRVKLGSILTWLTPVPLDIRSEQQRQAALQVAQAEKDAAQAQIARAKLELEHAGRELRRITALVEQGIRPPQDLDQFQTEESTAKEALRAATFTSDAASAHIEEIRSTLLKGEVHAIPLRAPVDGVLLRITQQSERTVAAGLPIVEIGNSRRLEMVFEVLSTDAVKIKPGAIVIVENWGGDEFLQGRVRLIEPGAFTKVSALGVEEQRVNVIADLAADAPSLGDGYRVEADIVVWQTDDAIQVPVSALFRSGSIWNVFVLSGNHALRRELRIGQRNQRYAQVVQGLSQGETVVLYPDDNLSESTIIKSKPHNGVPKP